MKIKTILQRAADIIFGIASIAAMLLALFVLIVVSATPAHAYTNTAEWLNNKLARRSKPKTGLATKPTLVKRISKAKMRYLKRFDEYNKMRNQQPESERQTEFQLTEIHRLFGVHATTIERAIYYRQIKPRGKKLIRGHWVRTFKYEDLCSYFDILRGIPNGNDATTMGNS